MGGWGLLDRGCLDNAKMSRRMDRKGDGVECREKWNVVRGNEMMGQEWDG